MKFFLSILAVFIFVAVAFCDIRMCGVKELRTPYGADMVILSYDPGSGSCSGINVSAEVAFVSFDKFGNIWSVSKNGNVYIKPESGEKYYNSNCGSSVRDISAHSNIAVVVDNGYTIKRQDVYQGGGSWWSLYNSIEKVRAIEYVYDEDQILYLVKGNNIISFTHPINHPNDGYEYMYPTPPGSYTYDITSKIDADVLVDYVAGRTLETQFDAGYNTWQFEAYTYRGKRVDSTEKGTVSIMCFNNYTYVSLDGSIIFVTPGSWHDIAIEQ